MRLPESTPHPELEELLRKAKDHVMSPREIWLQRVSWAYGQMMDCAPDVTREHVEAAAEELYGPCPTEVPTDEDYDDMLHALGRPDNVLKESYRNHYCVEADSDTAQRFEALGCWTKGATINNGRDSIYQVNALGRRVLSEWVRRRHAAQ